MYGPPPRLSVIGDGPAALSNRSMRDSLGSWPRQFAHARTGLRLAARTAPPRTPA